MFTKTKNKLINLDFDDLLIFKTYGVNMKKDFFYYVITLLR